MTPLYEQLDRINAEFIRRIELDKLALLSWDDLLRITQIAATYELADSIDTLRLVFQQP